MTTLGQLGRRAFRSRWRRVLPIAREKHSRCLWTRHDASPSTTALRSVSGWNITKRFLHHSPRRTQADSTIYALSSAPGRAAIAVVRISGPACLEVLTALCPDVKPPMPRKAAVRTLYQPGVPPCRESILDSSALVLYFRAPSTATGEDVLELHVHGGPSIVRAVLAAISNCCRESPGKIRYAEAGEFTRRAFMNDRLDLTQAEALGDVLAADTEQQRRLSMRGTAGGLARQYEEWRQQLLYARGELEALIDFSEDQHFDESPDELCASVAKQALSLKRALHIHSENAVRGELLRHGISISLLGAPNAGKSSLLNRIVGREAAIVSSEAGTTRDIVEIGVDLGGYFCRFGDTAGLRQAQPGTTPGSRKTPASINKIEIEGIRRAKARAAESDLVIVVCSFDDTRTRGSLQLDPEVCSVTRHLLSTKPSGVILAINKSDLADDEAAQQRGMHEVLHEFPSLGKDDVHFISCRADDSVQSESSDAQSADPGGMQAFLRGLIQRFGALTAAVVPSEASPDADPSIWQESLGASERHRSLLQACVSHLDAFLREVSSSALCTSDLSQQGNDVASEPCASGHEADIVVAAEHLRYAADCLAQITGKGQAGDVEEVLGVVFEKFCVGK